MGEVFAWAFIGFVAIVFVCILYDSMKCKHEWEHCSSYIYDPKTGLNIKVTYLLCKKCGKVKVLK